MKNKILLPIAALSALFASCATQSGGEDYDVSNPYSAPDYGDDGGTPYEQSPSDVNPAYDAPAVYEDTTPTPAPAPSAPSRIATVHTVVRGDTLSGIGRKYGVSVAAIQQANNLPNDIAVLGAKLKIPAK
ncbi:MAG: LysM peptidoglycan-binding domain-containing protein [Luteolibacter sp.]